MDPDVLMREAYARKIEEDVAGILNELRAERDRYRAALEQVAPMQQRTLEMLRREGFRFETRLDLSDGWEKLAFTLYSTICEIDAHVANVLEGEA